MCCSDDDKDLFNDLNYMTLSEAMVGSRNLNIMKKRSWHKIILAVSRCTI